MPFENEALRVTQAEINANGVTGMPDIPALSTQEMQQAFDKLPTYIGREKLNALLTALSQPNTGVLTDAEVRQLIADAVLASGSGDMTSLLYDPQGKKTDIFAYADQAVVDVSNIVHNIIAGLQEIASGFNTYTHTAVEIDPGVYNHVLTGSGNNIKVKFTEAWHDNDTIEVNGETCTPIGADGVALPGDAIDAGSTVFCFLDGTTLNFKTGGGAGMDYKVVAVASESNLPIVSADKTVAVITGVPITEHTWSADEPTPTSAGFVWFLTYDGSAAEMTLDKKSMAKVAPVAAMQWDGTKWVYRVAKTMLNGSWVPWWNPLYTFGVQHIPWAQGFMSGSGGSVGFEADSIRLTSATGGVSSVGTTQAVSANYRRFIAIVSVPSYTNKSTYFVTATQSGISGNPMSSTFRTLIYTSAVGKLGGEKYIIRGEVVEDIYNFNLAISNNLGSVARVHAVFGEPM